jgi:hypothetical protein
VSNEEIIKLILRWLVPGDERRNLFWFATANKVQYFVMMASGSYQKRVQSRAVITPIVCEK